MVEQLEAVEIIRRMRGGSQAQLVRCSDGGYYVVKFQNNPQGKRSLVNELIGTLLAEHLGLPVANTAIVTVSERLIRLTEDAVVQLQKGGVPYKNGRCFGSRVLAATEDQTLASYDFVFETLLPRITNPHDFLGMLVFDKWTCNVDNRQTVLVRNTKDDGLKAMMIDQGDCFNRSQWNFPDCPSTGLLYCTKVYRCVRCIEDFDPWLARLERQTDIAELREIGKSVPEEWYDADKDSLDRLLVQLHYRCSTVRKLVLCTLSSRGRDFPNVRAPSGALTRTATAT